MADKLKLDGIPITVVPDNETEKADFYICSPASMPGYFTDDLFADCFKCGSRVRFRPHGPKKPPKICFPCALEHLKDVNRVVTTAETADEVKDYKKKRQN